MLHDGVIKWKYFPRYWPFVRGIHRSPVDSAHKGQWRRALMFSLICTWTNGWANNWDVGDLRHHSAYYDVTVMTWVCFLGKIWLDKFCQTPCSQVHYPGQLSWTNSWENNRDSSDLRHHHAYYDVTVMIWVCVLGKILLDKSCPTPCSQVNYPGQLSQCQISQKISYPKWCVSKALISSIFLEILIIDTPQLAFEDELNWMLFVSVKSGECHNFVILMGWCKKDVTPVHKQWSYIVLALIHRFVICNMAG